MQPARAVPPSVVISLVRKTHQTSTYFQNVSGASGIASVIWAFTVMPQLPHVSLTQNAQSNAPSTRCLPELLIAPMEMPSRTFVAATKDSRVIAMEKCFASPKRSISVVISLVRKTRRFLMNVSGVSGIASVTMDTKEMGTRARASPVANAVTLLARKTHRFSMNVSGVSGIASVTMDTKEMGTRIPASPVASAVTLLAQKTHRFSMNVSGVSGIASAMMDMREMATRMPVCSTNAVTLLAQKTHQFLMTVSGVSGIASAMMDTREMATRTRVLLLSVRSC